MKPLVSIVTPSFNQAPFLKRTIEPPIMERLTAWGYRLVGKDDLRIPRFLSIFFWTTGGIGLFLLLRTTVGAKGAVIGLAYYMVLPFPLYASRSFQPEPLMTAAIIYSWWAIIRWARHKSWVNAVLAGLISGFAIYIKLPSIFFVAPALIAAVFFDQKFVKAIIDPQVISMAILAVVPALAYHVDGLYISGYLEHQTNFRVFPEMLVDPYSYWLWLSKIASTMRIENFVLGLAGILVIKEKRVRIVFLSIIAGYLVYGFVFIYHIGSHTYYQIPLIPAIAMGLAACAALLIEHLPGRKTFGLVLISGLLFCWVAYNFMIVRENFRYARYHDQPEFYAALGDKLREYDVVSITPDYGYRLGYWGWKQTNNWLSSGDFIMRELAGVNLDKAALFAEAVEGSELFLVTDFDEFNRQPDVKEILYDTYPIYEQGEGYLIFDLRETQ